LTTCLGIGIEDAIPKGTGTTTRVHADQVQLWSVHDVCCFGLNLPLEKPSSHPMIALLLPCILLDRTRWIGPVWIPLDLSKHDLTSSMGNGEIAQAGTTNRRDQALTRRVGNLISGHVCSGLIVFLRLSYRDLPDRSRIPERMFVLHRPGLLQAGELRDGQKVQR